MTVSIAALKSVTLTLVEEYIRHIHNILNILCNSRISNMAKMQKCTSVFC